MGLFRKVVDVFGVVLWCQKVEAGRRGRKSCASCSAATWWRAVGLEGKHSVNPVCLRGKLLLRLNSEKEIDKANVYAVAHDMAGLIPAYA